MAYDCPTCGTSSQVVKVETYWASLPQDAEAKRSLAAPPGPAIRFTGPFAVGAVGVVALFLGHVVFGLLLLLVAGMVAVTFMRSADAARIRRAEWEQERYCLHCGSRFLPVEAKV